MSNVICQGCGQVFAVPAGYARNKIQCPGCGVICAVPEGGGAAAPPQKPARPAQAQAPTSRHVDFELSADEFTPRLAGEDVIDADIVEERAPKPPKREPPPVRKRDSAPLREEVVPPRKAEEATFACRRCGRPVVRQGECAHCGPPTNDLLPMEPVARESRPVPAIAPGSLELDDLEIVEGDEFEDGPLPYETADGMNPRCPKCRKDMEFGAIVCVSCGFNLLTRKKAKRKYEPIDRTWETDYPLVARIVTALIFVSLHFFASLIAMAGGYPYGMILFLPMLVMTAFVTGTFDIVRIVRDERGRVLVSKQWLVAFIPMPQQRTQVKGFEGVMNGGWNDAGPLEYTIFIMLFCVGCIPALVWYYVGIYQCHYHVALSESHGFKSVTVYRGRSQQQMEEVTEVLCDATGLLLRR